jgi:hypothetical protein
MHRYLEPYVATWDHIKETYRLTPPSLLEKVKHKRTDISEAKSDYLTFYQAELQSAGSRVPMAGYTGVQVPRVSVLQGAHD